MPNFKLRRGDSNMRVVAYRSKNSSLVASRSTTHQDNNAPTKSTAFSFVHVETMSCPCETGLSTRRPVGIIWVLHGRER